MLASAYRDAAAGAQLRYDDQLSRWSGRLTNLSAVECVHAARAGRIAAASVGIAGAALLPVVALVDLPLRRFGQGDLLFVCLAIWPAMGLAGWLGRRASRRSLRVAALAPAPSGDPFADLARLRADRPARRLHDLAEAQERASVSLPLVALSLLMPLSIHTAGILLCALLAGRPAALLGFDAWIGVSLIVATHSHLLLAGFGRDFGRRLPALADDEVLDEADRASSSAVRWTIWSSALPGVLLFFIPPIVTAITAKLFCRTMYQRLAATVLRERALLRG